MSFRIETISAPSLTDVKFRMDRQMCLDYVIGDSFSCERQLESTWIDQQRGI